MEISEKILYLFILLNFYATLSYNYATAGGSTTKQIATNAASGDRKTPPSVCSGNPKI